ncbi:hypothetical protein [Streptomyces sp. TR06-5]|uniref:hypothetical protein n=1 Tax=Streptomyces sp. TR06-5 TaxID=3385976 RepID=UPI0039A0F802
MNTFRAGRNDALRSVLDEASWTYGQLAIAVNAASTRTGRTTRYDRTAVAHWISGTRPRPPVRQLIREVLSARLGRPLTLADIGFRAPTPEAARPTTPYQPVPALPPVPCSLPGKNVPSDTSARRRDHALGRFTDLALYHLEAFGSGYTHRTFATHFEEAATPWIDGNPTPSTLIQTARLTHILAHTMADLNEEGKAQDYHLKSARLAYRANDHEHYAIALRALSAQALRTGYPHLSLKFARRSLRAVEGRHTTRNIDAYLHAQFSAALAATRHREEALSTLMKAERNLESDPFSVGDSKSPFETYSVGDFSYQKASTLTSLGEHTAALRALRTSLRAREPHRIRSRALTRARLAELLHSSGHIEAACEHWRHFIDQAVQLHSAQATMHVMRMRSALRPWRHVPGAAELLDDTA